MTERPVDLSNFPSFQAPKRKVFSLRKFALMASVVAGLGAAAYGFGPSHGPVDVFTSSAHAQVNNEVRKVAQPVGFADIVERVKPSVISVKVAMGDKTAKDDTADKDDSPFQPGSPMERFFRRFGGPDGLPPGLKGGPRGGGVVRGGGGRMWSGPRIPTRWRSGMWRIRMRCWWPGRRMWGFGSRNSYGS